MHFKSGEGQNAPGSTDYPSSRRKGDHERGGETRRRLQTNIMGKSHVKKKRKGKKRKGSKTRVKASAPDLPIVLTELGANGGGKKRGEIMGNSWGGGGRLLPDASVSLIRTMAVD